MQTQRFSFTQEQLENLKKWAKYLDIDEVRGWLQSEEEAVKKFNKILNDAKFSEGNELTGDQLDGLFECMKEISSNRALGRNLYEKGLPDFNARLRTLLFGQEPLANRIDPFFELRGVAKMTMSHFLCAFNPSEYPLVTSLTFDVLDLDSTQLSIASRQSLAENNISPQNYHELTTDYLRDAIIFREIKNILNLESYFQVNNLLWKAHVQRAGGEIEPIPSVSLEADLRRHLAKNVWQIEDGLTLIGEKYRLGDTGWEIDILCKDRRDCHVVVETKKGREGDKVVGQTLRYMGWLKKNENKKVRGIIIVSEPDEKLDYAVAATDNIRVKYYKVKFDIADTP